MRKDDPFATRYRLDASDRIAWIGPAWDDFARRNDAPRLSADHVIGRSLWSFVAGDTTRTLYGLLFDRVRGEGRTLVVPFRCDSPEVRRFMELEVAPGDASGLELAAILLREERRMAVPLLMARQPRSDETVPICSFCKRIPVPGEGWLPAEEAVAARQLLGAPWVPTLLQEVCPACAAGVRETARAAPS